MLGAARVRRFRENAKLKKRQEDQEPSLNVNTALMHGANVASSSQAISDVAEISHPGKDWQKTCNGIRGGAVVAKATRMNYYHPYV